MEKKAEMGSKAILDFLLFLSLLLSFAPPIVADYRAHHCNYAKNFTKGSSTEQHLQQLLQTLTTNASSDFATATSATSHLYGLLQCRRDLPITECAACSNSSADRLRTECPNQVDAMVWFDECFLRYNNESFFSTLDTSYYTYLWNSFNNTNDTAFKEKLGKLMPGLIARATTSGGGFAKGVTNYTPFNKIYGLVQCNQDISMGDCSNCLDVALGRIPGCCEGKKGGRILLENCYLRFEADMFYSDNLEGALVPAPAPQNNEPFQSPPMNNATTGGGVSKARGIYYVFGGIGGGVLFLGLAFFVFRLYHSKNGRKGSTHPAPSQVPSDQDNTEAHLSSKVMEIFSWDAIVAATDNFSTENKLGEGGFGSVYKGKLVNGKEVAVKKLSMESRQGNKEFLNEVELVAGFQHRNLVRLIGCCAEAQQRVLIYEYMPNRSLDTFLLDPSRRRRLDWQTRFEIIMGVARGLLYLHEDLNVHVIHRDIKAANILLDKDLRPKIADFGMAHLFPDDRSHISTLIAGTYGYMAPEYAMNGILSTKADIYSFGVLVLEIISGHKNNDPNLPMAEHGAGLVGLVWRLHKQGRPLEIVDQALGDNWPEQVALRCIHVALLCTESRSSRRPSTSIVMSMLSSDSVTLPALSAPSSTGSSASSIGSSRSGSVPSTMHGTASAASLSPAYQVHSRNELTITEIEGR